MKANVIMEVAKDGGFSCFTKESFEGFALFGYGASAKEAKDDMLQGFAEINEMMTEEGKEPIELEFQYHYDMKSFFDYFNFLNVSKLAEIAGINPSLMRKYTSGVANAGEGQYMKLHKAIKNITAELQEAAF